MAIVHVNSCSGPNIERRLAKPNLIGVGFQLPVNTFVIVGNQAGDEFGINKNDVQPLIDELLPASLVGTLGMLEQMLITGSSLGFLFVLEIPK